MPIKEITIYICLSLLTACNTGEKAVDQYKLPVNRKHYKDTMTGKESFSMETVYHRMTTNGTNNTSKRVPEPLMYS